MSSIEEGVKASPPIHPLPINRHYIFICCEWIHIHMQRNSALCFFVLLILLYIYGNIMSLIMSTSRMNIVIIIYGERKKIIFYLT